MTPSRLLILSGLLLWTACSDDATNPTAPQGATSATSTGTGTGGGGAGGGGAGGSPLSIDWAPCPLDSNAATGTDAECALVSVPGRWDAPELGAIDVFVKRKRATSLPSRGQVWFLNGGPGYSGADFEPLAQNIADIDPTMDIYMPDHRGVGRSSRLGCDAESAASPGGVNITAGEMPGCLESLKAKWGARLDGFSMTNAARDVGELIDATRADSGFVVVYGGSYGSTWANRYMQLYPDQAAAILLDAVAITGPLSQIDAWFQDLGERWMDRCAMDPVCGAKLGADPWARMTDTLNAFGAGSCPAIAAMGFDRLLIASLGGYFFYDQNLRKLIAPMIYRLDRCAPEDVAAYSALLTALTTPAPADNVSGYFSIVLSAHVALSEMWETPAPTQEALETAYASANVVHGLAATFASYDQPWPRYPLDEYAGQLGTTSARTLLLHGEYDFIPLSTVEPVVDHLAGPTSTFVLMPGAPHGTFQSPTTTGYLSCGGHLLKLVLDDPTVPLDTSCVDDVIPLTFDPDPALSLSLLGTDDAWDTTSSLQGRGSGAPSKSALDPQTARAFARARHELEVTGALARLRPAR